jgi:hypothetical protein
MKNEDVSVGRVYAVKVSGQVVPVMLTTTSRYGGWNGLNLTTKRDVRIHSAAKLRFELEKNPVTNKWRQKVKP